MGYKARCVDDATHGGGEGGFFKESAHFVPESFQIGGHHFRGEAMGYQARFVDDAAHGGCGDGEESDQFEPEGLQVETPISLPLETCNERRPKARWAEHKQKNKEARRTRKAEMETNEKVCNPHCRFTLQQITTAQ